MKKKCYKAFARYVNDVGKNFCSLSYTRLNDNVSESVVQLKDKKNVQIQCFAKMENDLYAVVKYYTNVLKLNILPESVSSFCEFCYEVKDLGPLESWSVTNLCYKVVALPVCEGLKISVMKEGFEHI